MRKIKKQQTKIIHSNTAEDFEERLNNYLSQLADAGVKYDLSFNNNLGFCAYIVYTEVFEVAESLAEEYELRGEGHRCTECIYCRIPDDKRVKNFKCSLHASLVCKESWCCEEFYEKLMNEEEVLRVDS